MDLIATAGGRVQRDRLGDGSLYICQPDAGFRLKLPHPAADPVRAAGLYEAVHAKYQSPEKLAELITINRVDDWQGLHAKMGRAIRPENPSLPTLEAWRPRTAPPAEQFVFERNAYFHRVDQIGQQLPYLDRIVLDVASADIIPAKTATGESDLQANGISFPDYTLMKQAEISAEGCCGGTQDRQRCFQSELQGWSTCCFRMRMRRALSVAINRTS